MQLQTLEQAAIELQSQLIINPPRKSVDVSGWKKWKNIRPMNAVNIGAFSSIRNKKDKNLTQSVRISDARMNSSTTQGSPQLQDDLDAQVRRVT